MAGNNPSNNNFSPDEPDKNLVSQFFPPVAPPLAVYDVVVASAIAIEAGLVYVQWHSSKDYDRNNEEIRFDPNKTDALTAVKEHFANKRVEIKPEAETVINRANNHTFNLGVALRQEQGGFARHEVGPYYDTRHTPEAPKESLGGFEKQAPPDSNDTQHAPEPEAPQEPYISPKGNEPLAPSIDFSKDNNRISSPYWMKKNYEAAYGKLPEGYQIHHLMPDKVARTQELVRETIVRAKYDLDRAPNLIGVPGTVKAYEQSDMKLFHLGSHPEWERYAKKVLGDEQIDLESIYGTLDRVPADVLEKTMQKVETQLRGDIQNIELGIKKGWIKPEYQRGETKINKISEVAPNQGIEKANNPKQVEGTNNDEFIERLNSITERIRGNSATLGQNRVAPGTASADLERTFAEYKSASGQSRANLEQIASAFERITPLVEPPVRPKLELGGLIQAESQNPSEQSADFDQLIAERWQKSVSASLEIQRQQSGGQDGPVLEL